jgi:hypothetical protein
MKPDFSHPQTRLYFSAAMTLLVGWGSSVAIYLTAKDTVEDVTISAFENSKAFRHDLELYGGKVNVMANDFMGWVDGLWQGKTLAITVAVITAFSALILFAIGYYLLHDEKPDDPPGNRGE